MSITRTVKTNFTAGEVSPLLLGRGDLRAYDNGALTLRNVFIYIMAITWGAQMLSIAYTIIVSPENSAKVMAGMADLSTIWGVGLAVLGIYVYHRNEEKVK